MRNQKCQSQFYTSRIDFDPSKSGTKCIHRAFFPLQLLSYIICVWIRLWIVDYKSIVEAETSNSSFKLESILVANQLYLKKHSNMIKSIEQESNFAHVKVEWNIYYENGSD
jgi:hypothetical protein